MKIFIAGIVHFDVLGRYRLSKWINEVSEKMGNLPEFVAVEWDKEVFKQIYSQRILIRNYAKSEWPAAPPKFIDIIESSMGFEGDTHKLFSPNIETLWMDQGRPIEDMSIITEYAMDRFNIYRKYFPDGSFDFGPKTLLHMSKKAWARASPDTAVGSPRDAIFFEVILSRLNRLISDWAIVIVGASHARKNEGFLAKRLMDEGLSCYSKILRP